MTPEKTALLLIGFQNDYFAEDGILRAVVEDSVCANDTLRNTLRVIDNAGGALGLVVSTPIHFTANYGELVEPVGILDTIRKVGAFRAGTPGAEPIPELARYGALIREVPGKRGLDAFSNTDLDAILRAAGIEDILIAGVVTSVCIDSTARSATERGYRVTVLSDCTAGRSQFEQQFYCESIFPIYANVADSQTVLAQLGAECVQ